MARTKPKSDIVSSTGTAFEIVKRLSDEVGKLGGNDDHLRGILRDPELARDVAKLLIAAVLQPKIYPLTIDYSWSRAKMVLAGKYYSADNIINAMTFPVGKGKAKVDAVLVSTRKANAGHVIAEIFRQGLRPATMDELCAFGAQHVSRYANEHRIMALGSRWIKSNGYEYYPYISFGELRPSQIYLCADSNIYPFTERSRFLAVCK